MGKKITDNRTSIEASDKTLKVRIYSVRNNPFPRIMLLILIIVSVAFPLSILFIDNLEIGFGYIITLAIFFGTAIYLSRKYLWNYYGREVFDINKNKLNHYFDYKFFKDGFESISFTTLKVGYSEAEDPDSVYLIENKNLDPNHDYYLSFIMGDKAVRSFLPISSKYITELSVLLDKKEI